MKKGICFIIVFTIFINCSFFGANSDNLEVQENADYVKFNLDDESMTYHSFDDLPNAAGNTDGASTPGYFPNGIEYIDENSASTYAIVGSEDSRAPVSSSTIGPYCNTVFIRTYYEYNGATYVSCGSGFMIGPSAVGTAAHCVYNVFASYR